MKKTPKLLTKDEDPIIDSKGNYISIKNEEGNTLYDTKTYERTDINIEVRLGAIYALERVALDSKRDKLSIMRTIAAYIRNNISTGNSSLLNDINSRPDIKSAFEVLGRFPIRSETNVSYELTSIFLGGITFRDSNFASCDFSQSVSMELISIDSSFEGAIFHDIKWEKVRFIRSDISSASFRDADLSNSYIISCEFSDTGFWGTKFKNSQLRKSKFSGALFDRCNFETTVFEAAEFTNCRFNKCDLSNSLYRGSVFIECSFIECDISYSDMREAKLERNDFLDCNLTRTLMIGNDIIQQNRNFIAPEEWINTQFKAHSIREYVKILANEEWRQWIATRRSNESPN